MSKFKFGDMVRHPDFETECVFIRQYFDSETGQKTWAEVFNDDECETQTRLVTHEHLELIPSKTSGWISVNEAVPSPDDTVLLRDLHNNMRSGYLDGDAEAFVYTDSDSWIDDGVITHWRPLPTPPEKE
ncbi:TPA: DUF551 domain-containing protein [Neisseria weaveri]